MLAFSFHAKKADPRILCRILLRQTVVRALRSFCDPNKLTWFPASFLCRKDISANFSVLTVLRPNAGLTGFRPPSQVFRAGTEDTNAAYYTGINDVAYLDPVSAVPPHHVHNGNSCKRFRLPFPLSHHPEFPSRLTAFICLQIRALTHARTHCKRLNLFLCAVLPMPDVQVLCSLMTATKFIHITLPYI